MEPTPEQLRELYVQGFRLTGQLRQFIRLIDILPNGDLVIVSCPRNLLDRRSILYINLEGEVRYV